MANRGRNTFRITAKKDQLSGDIKRGQSFTVFSDNPRSPSHADVQAAIKEAGINFGFLNKPSAHESNWIIEKL